MLLILNNCGSINFRKYFIKEKVESCQNLSFVINETNWKLNLDLFKFFYNIFNEVNFKNIKGGNIARRC